MPVIAQALLARFEQGDGFAEAPEFKALRVWHDTADDFNKNV